jgi:hypothetical protein
MPLSRRVFAAVLVLEAAAALVAAATIVDLRMHWAGVEARAVNMWGFRGATRLEAVGRRVALVGGSAAFGYGVDVTKSMPHYLGYFLDRKSLKAPHPTRVDLVNLAAAGDGASSFVKTLRAYAYLKPDTVCIYDGYAGPALGGVDGVRHRSFVFRATGYFPVLGDVAAGRESLASPAFAIVDPMLRGDEPRDPTCEGASRSYCAAIADTVAWAVDRGLLAAVVTPPYVSRRHEAQQASLAAMLRTRFGGNPRVHYFNMGRVVDLADPRMSFDGVHLTARGNQTIAEELSTPLFAAMDPR